jgi:peptidyl-prolyl cis-trans isomerase A (cyclophilin A)
MVKFSRLIVVLSLSLFFLLLACSSSKPASEAAQPAATPAPALPPPPPEPLPDKATAIIETSAGTMTCELFPKSAPETVRAFIGLAEGTHDWVNPFNHKTMHGVPLYNGTVFHRVIPEFMIQGGDPTGTGMAGPGYKFQNEYTASIKFDKPGRLAMANAGPNTNGSQFFITEGAVGLDSKDYTIFGQCDEGIDVVKKIARVPKTPTDKDRPATPVVMEKVVIERVGAGA